MSTILHATDVSRGALPALTLAEGMSPEGQSTLVVLHVFDIPTIMNSPTEAATFQEIDRDVHRIDQANLEAFCREHLGDAAMDDGVRCMVKEHMAPVEAIMQVADELNVDMVVVGTRGQSRGRELLMGSTTKGLVKHSTRTVLVVPEEAPPVVPRKVVLATMLEGADVNAIEKCMRFSDDLKASMTLVHVAGPKAEQAAEHLADLMALVKERTGRTDLRHELVHAASVAEGLDAYLRSHPTDLLVMVEHERHGLIDLLFHRDKVTGMVFHTTIPTLVLHEGWSIA